VPRKTSALALKLPIEPMLAKLADALPVGDYLYEPKWDGFRALVFRDTGELYMQSRDARPLDRYFPELHASLLDRTGQELRSRRGDRDRDITRA